MAYNTKSLFEKAMQEVKDRKLFFLDDVIAYLPCSKPTFYDHFPVESDLLNAIKEELDKNKVEIKSAMRIKWYNSDNATLQVALMKLICTDDERKALSPAYVDKTEVNVNGEGMKFNITRHIITDKENEPREEN